MLHSRLDFSPRALARFCRVGVLATLVAAAACADGDGAGPELIDAATPDADTADASAEAAVRPVCTSGMDLPCICADGGSGSRACIEGQLADTCGKCQAPTPLEPNISPCQAGRFVGRFDVPQYLPTPAGACGIGTLFGGPGSGKLEFTLRNAGEGIELVHIVEAESCFEMELEQPEGEDSPGMVTAPVFALTGEVDCNDGVFEGELRGAYQSVGLCTADDWYSVKGTLRAVYDPATETFTDGTVDFYEPEQLGDILGLSGRAGGSGTWQATLDADAEPPEPVDDCLGDAEFTDFEI